MCVCVCVCVCVSEQYVLNSYSGYVYRTSRDCGLVACVSRFALVTQTDNQTVRDF